MKREGLIHIKMFLQPLPFLMLLILPDGIFTESCPKQCLCDLPDAVVCSMRHSQTVPAEVDSSAKGLFLFANGIEGIKPEDFQGLNNLEILDLSQNKLTHLPERVFEPLTSLKNLDLSSNQITYISEECFDGVPKLERLYLYSNYIESIHPDAFNGLENLLELKLQGNLLTSLPTLVMPSLLLLDLCFNTLPTLGPSDLHVPSLESLRLGGLELTSLNKELIGSLKNLHELDISGNKLESFPSALKESSGLLHLNLAGNPMGPLKIEDLQNLRDLTELDISSLSIQSLPEEFSQNFPHLTKLTIAQNPFNCHCNLAWFPRWLRAQGITLQRTEETRCHFPPINAGKVLERLEHRDFSCPITTTTTTSTVKTTMTSRTDPVTIFSATKRPSQDSKDSDKPTETDLGSSLPPVPASPSSSSIEEDENDFCSPDFCLNGGTCHVGLHGEVECACLEGISGKYCQDQNPSPSYTDILTDVRSPIRPQQETATSILLDFHHYFEKRPDVHGIRLTYRNLSGPDQRPIHLNLPAHFREYRLRGLHPNSNYTVCVSPLGTTKNTESFCTRAHTIPEKTNSNKPEDDTPKLTTLLYPTASIILILVLIAVAVGVVCYRRKKKDNNHLDMDCEPSQLELDGVKAGLDNGALPQKPSQLILPEPVFQNGSLEYEVLLIQDHCTSNNNMSYSKPSYF